jgi:hypothetical protein|tara:strand:+ start:195 stop:458 length:264 start_codon:yes stop_codon:yes gene_type:complete
MIYQEYCELLKLVFSEELERLEEYLYSIKNNYDCSADKHWVLTPNQDLPSYEEMIKVMSIYGLSLKADEINEDQVSDIKEIWYNEVS